MAKDKIQPHKVENAELKTGMLSYRFLSFQKMSEKSFIPQMQLRAWIPATEPIHIWGQAYGEMCIMYNGRLPD